MSYCHHIIEAAKCTDPVLRMKHVLAYLIAGLHFNPCKWVTKTPINPLLGETFQASNELGMNIYVEQTSKNPSTQHFHCTGPDGLFELMGYSISTAKMTGVNTLRGGRDGKNIIKFKDGTLMTWICPDL